MQEGAELWFTMELVWTRRGELPALSRSTVGPWVLSTWRSLVMLARVGIGWPSAGKSTPLRGLTKIVGGLVVGFGGGEGPWLGFGFFNSGDDVADWRPSRYGSLLLAVPFLPPATCHRLVPLPCLQSLGFCCFCSSSLFVATSIPPPPGAASAELPTASVNQDGMRDSIKSNSEFEDCSPLNEAKATRPVSVSASGLLGLEDLRR